jgi:hypothetical protein
MKRFVLIALLAASVCLGGGCSMFGGSKKPSEWNVKLTKVTDASICVDMFGVSRSEIGYWQNVKIKDYWDPKKSLRKEVENRKKTTCFEDSKEYVLRQSDPIWKQWFGYGTHDLIVIADLLDKENTLARQVVPLAPRHWDAKKHTLEIEISDTQVRVITPEKD